MTRPPPPITTLACLPPAVVEPYREAHEWCAILPAHALVQARGALAALVEAWLGTYRASREGTLYDQIERLVPHLRLDGAHGDELHALRRAGNLAAHPEQRRGPPPDRGAARDQLLRLHGFLALFAERVGGVSPSGIPAFVEPPEVHWAEVCERAIFQGDAAAMLAVGRRLREEAKDADREAERRAREEKRGWWPRRVEGLRDALVWFERAEAHATDERDEALATDERVASAAAYEQARILLVELPRPERVEAAEDLLRWAAEEDLPDAQALLAQLLLDPRSPLPQPRDAAEARAWAEKAARAEHPEALTILTVLYAHGEGVPRDVHRALAYARRASQAGYPLAHANLANLLLDMPPEERDEAEIAAAIARAKEAGVGHGYWAEYRLLCATDGGTSPAARIALEAAADASVPAALLRSAQLGMAGEPADWELARLVGWLVLLLSGPDAGDARAEGRALLLRVRDEGVRRFRDAPGRGAARDDLFALVLQAGAGLDLEPGEDPHARIAPLLGALARMGPSREGVRATPEEVALLQRAIPGLLPWALGRSAASPGGGGAAVRSSPVGRDSGQDRGGAVDAARGAPRRFPSGTGRPSRNGPCPCGSGRKFKGCCGRR